MGTWGTAISSNDTYADIYDAFFECYHEGQEVEEISQRLIQANQETINDPNDCHNFWFALATAQWECKRLDKDIFNRVKSIIDLGADIRVWRQLGAAEKDLKKRKLVLDKLLVTLSTEKPTPKSRKKKKAPILIQPVFEKGDCIIYKLANGNYGGAVVLEAIYHGSTIYPNLIATTRINKTEKPSLEDFNNSSVLVLNFARFNDEPNIQWYSPTKHHQVVPLIEVVGKIHIDKLYTYYVNNSTEYSACDDFAIWIIGQSNRQFTFELDNKKSDTVIPIKELTKNCTY